MITRSPILRMVVRAVGVGFRVFTSRTMAVYDDLPTALDAVRRLPPAGG